MSQLEQFKIADKHLLTRLVGRKEESPENKIIVPEIVKRRRPGPYKIVMMGRETADEMLSRGLPATVGDVVVYRLGIDIQLDGETYFIVESSSVVCVVPQ